MTTLGMDGALHAAYMRYVLLVRRANSMYYRAVFSPMSGTSPMCIWFRPKHRDVDDLTLLKMNEVLTRLVHASSANTL